MILSHLSLFSGIGGLDLAAELAGFTTIGQCEWGDFQTKVLARHWPGVPRWRDIRTLTRDSYEREMESHGIGGAGPVIVSGGFPCQPFSVAGQRKGTADNRFLWPEMLRVVAELRPRWVIGENVPGIVSMALDRVLSDLEGIGYTGRALIFPASAVNARHRRDRVAIIARDATDMADTNGQRWEEQYPSGIAAEPGQFNRGHDTGPISYAGSIMQTGGGSGSLKTLRKMRDNGTISDAECRSMSAGNGGKMNPTWVEWLMGFPRNWTLTD